MLSAGVTKGSAVNLCPLGLTGSDTCGHIPASVPLKMVDLPQPDLSSGFPVWLCTFLVLGHDDSVALTLN